MLGVTRFSFYLTANCSEASWHGWKDPTVVVFFLSVAPLFVFTRDVQSEGRSLMDAGSNTCWEAFVTYSNTACCGDTIKYNLTSAESCQLHTPTQVCEVQEKENMVTVNDSRMQQSKDSVRGKITCSFSFTVFILGLFSFGLNKSKHRWCHLKDLCYTLILLFSKIIKLNFVFCFFYP